MSKKTSQHDNKLTNNNENLHILSETVTCTCNGNKTVSKECPTKNATCDCSDPNNPKIICD